MSWSGIATLVFIIGLLIAVLEHFDRMPKVWQVGGLNTAFVGLLWLLVSGTSSTWMIAAAVIWTLSGLFFGSVPWRIPLQASRPEILLGALTIVGVLLTFFAQHGSPAVLLALACVTGLICVAFVLTAFIRIRRLSRMVQASTIHGD